MNYCGWVNNEERVEMQQKDLRQLKTQAKLHTAYISLQKQGYEKLTIHQLCKEASITRATFYNQFRMYMN